MAIRRRLLLALLWSLAVGGPARAADLNSPAHEWFVSGHVGTALGNSTEPSFAWRVGAHRWLSPGASGGVEVGRFRWVQGGRAVSLAAFEPFQGLAKGGDELQFASLAFRFHGEGVGAHALSPLVAVGMGVFRQPERRSSPIEIWPPTAREGEIYAWRYSPGWSFSFGGAATRGIAPGAEMRFDFVATSPDPSFYFSINAGVLAGL